MGAAQPSNDPRDGFDVLDACHRRMLMILSALEGVVGQVDRLGAAGDAERATAAAIVEFFAVTVRGHHDEEERHVFPPLLNDGDEDVVPAVLRLREDHGWLEENWRELEPLVSTLALGSIGLDIDSLRNGVGVFAALLRDHIALEESVIYPQARARLGEASRQAMVREMAAARRRQARSRECR